MKSLADWLDEIQQVHPKDWDLGLDRVGEVGRRLGLNHPAKTCFLVAGTNGKGSTCEFLSQLCRASNRSYGKTTSPFFHRYNEQIEINGHNATDEDIVRAFEVIREAAAEISLSYFEYGALAAMWLFREAEVDVGIFEIGLGGRLDAMNIIDPDVSIITRIALDHQDWLGDTREKIGFEKAGVMRGGKPVVILDPKVPGSVLDYAAEINARVKLVNQDFSFTSNELTLGAQSWLLNPVKLPLPSAVAALVAFERAGFAVEQGMLDEALNRAELPGRFQVIREAPLAVLDVCHNPDAAKYLYDRLAKISSVKHWHLVLGVYGDKDLAGIFQHLAPLSASWYVSSLDVPRGAAADELKRVLHESCGLGAMTYDKVASALEAVGDNISEQEGLAVLGSFSTVAAAIDYFEVNDL